MKKVLLLGVILAAVLVAGCNKDEGYDSLESLTYTARISDTQTYSYRFISESRYEYVMTYLSVEGKWRTHVEKSGIYEYDYPTLKIYSNDYSMEFYSTMKFQGRNMFKRKAPKFATDYSPWRPSASLGESGFYTPFDVEYQTYEFYLE